jgi:hypothetical protein
MYVLMITLYHRLDYSLLLCSAGLSAVLIFTVYRIVSHSVHNRARDKSVQIYSVQKNRVLKIKA